MTKFKVGDKVLFSCDYSRFKTVIVKATKIYDGVDAYIIKWRGGGDFGYCHNEHLTLIEEKNTMRKKVRLTKNTLEYKKGAIFEEKCDDGTQDFECITPDLVKYPNEHGEYCGELTRGVVEANPKVFEEVFSASEIYFTKEELKQVKKLAKK